MEVPSFPSGNKPNTVETTSSQLCISTGARAMALSAGEGRAATAARMDKGHPLMRPAPGTSPGAAAGGLPELPLAYMTQLGTSSF